MQRNAHVEAEQLQRTNVFLVATGWCLGYSAFFIQVTTTAAKAIDLKGTTLSTVPLGVLLFATWFASLLIPKLLSRFGNKIVYFCVALGGAVGAALCLVANEALEDDDASFALLIVGSAPQGIAHASTNSYRYAATQFAPPAKAPLAISLVIFGGVLSAVLGPEVSKYTRESMPTEYTGTYILLTATWAAQAAVMLLPAFKSAALPAQTADSDEKELASQTVAAVSVGSLLRRPKYLFGIFGGAVSFGAMAGLMAATPVAMKDRGFSFDTSTTTIELHVVGMFAPAIFTGKVVAALGPVRTVAAGLGVLLLGAVLLFISTSEAAVYMVGLTIIGIGWNWSTVASTALITKSFSKEEASTAQGLADGIIIGFLTIAVFTVGFLYKGLDQDWRLFVAFYSAITAVALVAALYLWIVGIEPPAASDAPQPETALSETSAALPVADAPPDSKTPHLEVVLSPPPARLQPVPAVASQQAPAFLFAPQPALIAQHPAFMYPGQWAPPSMLQGHA